MMLVSLEKLLEIVNPLRDPPWKEIKDSISTEEVKNSSLSSSKEEYDSLKPESREQHIAKIAYFVKHGWNDEPITIVFNKSLYPIYDGNHRLCAAIIRNDDFILANVEGNGDLIRKIAY